MTRTAYDPNSNMTFLRNEFSKIFVELLTMTKFSKMTHNFDQRRNLKLSLRPEFEVEVILKLADCKMSFKKNTRTKWDF